MADPGATESISNPLECLSTDSVDKPVNNGNIFRADQIDKPGEAGLDGPSSDLISYCFIYKKQFTKSNQYEQNINYL